MDAYQYWQATPAAQQALAAARADPSLAGYRQVANEWGNGYDWVKDTVDAYGNTAGVQKFDPNALTVADLPDPYLIQGGDPLRATNLEQASEAGLFGSTDYGFLENLKQTYEGLGKTDDQILQAAKDALTWHGQQFNEGYTPASDWGNINNKIAQNLGFSDFGGAEKNFHNLGGGFTADAAQTRGEIDKNRNYSGSFGQDNLFSSIASYEADRFGDISHAYKTDPERPLLGINTPFESKLWGDITGKDYTPTIDMYGGDTKQQQANYAQKGGDPTAGAFGHQVARFLVQQFFGQAGYGQAFGAVGGANNIAQKGKDTNWLSLLPAAASAASSSNLGGGSGNFNQSGAVTTLQGGVSNDTLGTGSTNMGDGYFDDFTGQWVDTSGMGYDPGGAGVYTAPATDPYGIGTDMYGNPTGQFAPSTFAGDTSNTMFDPSQGLSTDPTFYDLVKRYGQQAGTQLYNLLKNKIAGGSVPGLPGAGGTGLGGSGLLDTAARTAPGIAALAYAAAQPGIDVGQLNSILGQMGGNQDAVVKAATDPINANIAAGYGDILQNQSLRGIRGSSFGNTDIANYIATTSNALGNAGANAAQGSLALQGNLAGTIATLKNQAQQIKNSLYGRAFDTLGRGLNPTGYIGANLGGATP